MENMLIAEGRHLFLKGLYIYFFFWKGETEKATCTLILFLTLNALTSRRGDGPVCGGQPWEEALLQCSIETILFPK